MMNFLNRVAQVVNDPNGAGNSLTNLPEVNADDSAVQAALVITFSIATAIAVLIIVIQGIKFTLSSGDPEKAASARKGVIYAIVGLIVALSANIIVLTVLEDVL